MQNLAGSRRDNILLVKRILRGLGARPRRRLGQSFLVDPRGLDLFARAVESVGGGPWLEVGSGPGILTCRLAQHLGSIVSVEIDWLMARAASGLCRDEGRALVVLGDGLAWAGLWKGMIVSNTPYNLTSALIAATARNNSVDSAVLGMQKELALRVMARPGSKSYGRLTVLARLFFKPELVGVLRRDWFYPRPKVDGAIVVMRRARSYTSELEGFERFTACLFSQRNKLASKVIRYCTGGFRPPPDMGDNLRVRDLPPEAILEVFLEWRRSSWRREGSG